MTQSDDLRTRFLALGRDVLSVEVEARDLRGAHDPLDWRPLWDAVAEAGVLGLVLPETYGGTALPVLPAIRALHALGEGCRDNGMLLSICGQLWAMQMSILEFGSDDQKSRWLPRLVDGRSICAHCVTEAESGSDSMSMQTRAERTESGYRITGEKVWIGMGPAADLGQVFAVTDPSRGPWGLSVFLVDLATPGISRSEPYDKAGHRTVPAGSLRFDGVEVPEAARLGPEGAGQSIFNRSIDWERRFIFAAHVGAMKRQLDDCVAFARSRKPGGTAIISHQSVANRLADMHTRWHGARLMIEDAAREIDEGREDRRTAATVKLAVSEALLANAQDALRIGGGSGYLRGDAERMLRDMAGTVTLGGTSDIQRKIIAALQ